MIKNDFKPAADYTTPACKTIVFAVHSVLCDSYGDAGRAGGDAYYNDLDDDF